MSPRTRTFILAAGLAALIYFSVSMARRFVAAGEPVFGIAEGILIPAAVLWELRRSWKIGTVAADASVRMMTIVALALACAVYLSAL